MKKLLIPLITVCVTAAPAFAAENADQILQATSAKLAKSQRFTFSAKRELDPALNKETGVPEKARIKVSVLRPNKIAVDAATSAGSRRVIADGRQLTYVDGKNNYYAQVPMRTSIDGLVNALDAVYGFTPPLAEFALSNPYREFHRNASSVAYKGNEKLGGLFGLGGIECHRIALQGKLANAELWIGVADQLPHKLVVTIPIAGHPQMRVEFSSWDLKAPLLASDFAFTPPKGAQKIEMWSTAKMNAALKH